MNKPEQKNVKKILLVCMGNICRSPAAEGYLRYHLQQSGLADQVSTDSAGTHGYHVGNPPDSRSVSACAARGVDISDLRARRVNESDFDEFDLIIAMDEDNYENLTRARSGSRAEIRMMLDFADRYSSVHEVPDPYYGGEEGFETMCDLLDDAAQGLVATLKPEFKRA